MTTKENAPIPPGWIGGFAQSNEAFEYPDPNLTSLPMLDNLANIDLLRRQQAVEWPEFSWLTQLGDESSRCYQMFAPYISRLGYTDTGRVYSIICPQQGVWLGDAVCLNVEVTVTGQRGWADEDNKTLAADMMVEGKIWFSVDEAQSDKLSFLLHLLEYLDMPFPLSKKNAIRVTTHDPGNPDQPIFPLRKGHTKDFKIPKFAKHNEAWTVGNLEVEIGDIKKLNHTVVDDFNEMVMTVFNLGSGNMLHAGNILAWNVWFRSPELVDQEEWRTHAERWRKSIDEHHGSPDGEGTSPRYFDGTPFSAEENAAEEMVKALIKYIEGLINKHTPYTLVAD